MLILFVIISGLICIATWCIRFDSRRKLWIENNVITANTEDTIFECYVFSTEKKNTTKIYYETINELEELEILSTYSETVDDCQKLIDELYITLTLGEKIICKRYFISGTYYLYDGKIATDPESLYAYR